MEKEFVTYTQALALKELGFDEPCFGCYDEKGVFGLTVMSIKDYYTNTKEDTWNCSAPLKQQVFRWFREKGYTTNIYSNCNDGSEWYFLIKKGTITTNDNTFDSYEEAENACIDKLIEIVKNK